MPNEMFQAPPMSPPSPEGIPTDASVGSSEPVTPEQRTELQDLMEEIKNNMSRAQSTMIETGNKVESATADSVAEVVSLMQQAGVDTSDASEVSRFIERIRAQNPTVAAFLENALDGLLGGAGNAADTGDAGSFEFPENNDINYDSAGLPKAV